MGKSAERGGIRMAQFSSAAEGDMRDFSQYVGTLFANEEPENYRLTPWITTRLQKNSRDTTRWIAQLQYANSQICLVNLQGFSRRPKASDVAAFLAWVVDDIRSGLGFNYGLTPLHLRRVTAESGSLLNVVAQEELIVSVPHIESGTRLAWSLPSACDESHAWLEIGVQSLLGQLAHAMWCMVVDNPPDAHLYSFPGDRAAHDRLEVWKVCVTAEIKDWLSSPDLALLRPQAFERLLQELAERADRQLEAASSSL
jgi:hypothetical protein